MSYIVVRVQGHTCPTLSISPVSGCGNIALEDGVGFEHVAADGKGSGGWVISFNDLVLIYAAARKARGLDKIHEQKRPRAKSARKAKP